MKTAKIMRLENLALYSMNINSHLQLWLGDYLSGRSQYAAPNGESSTSVPVISGVPQGSILGPLLFVIYINGICEIPLNDGCMMLYADNILLYRQIGNQSDFLLLQEDINPLQNWFSPNFLEQNPNTCLYQENVCVL